MTAPAWRQVTITFPDPPTAPQQARRHLAPVLVDAEGRRFITTWFYVRKDAWRLRYLPTTTAERHVDDELQRLIREHHIRAAIPGVYEPETYAFGGREAMNAAHQLWHHDSRNLLTHSSEPGHDRETSIILVAAMMRAAGLDWYEQGDVWARVAEHRDPPTPGSAAATLDAVKRLLTVDPADLTGPQGPLAGHRALAEAYIRAGEGLRDLHQHGLLHRGLREILAHHVIFTWNRRSIPGQHQAAIATTAKTLIFGPDPTLTAPTRGGA
jgi:thiopeptide-type bacteriocin biosynthesis protein